MSIDQQAAGSSAPARVGSLAPVALGLGLAGMLLGIVPFYGLFLGLPLSVIALVLGLVARSRPWESRRQATGGIVTATLGLLLALAWAGTMFWSAVGFGQFASETAFEVGVVDDAVVDEIEATPETDPGGDLVDPPPVEDDAPMQVDPTEPGPAMHTDLSGEARLTLDDETHTLALPACALGGSHAHGVLVRAEGPDGHLVVARPDGLGPLVVDLDVVDGPTRVLVGQVHGMSASGREGGPLLDGHRFELDGQLRDLRDEATVTVHVDVTCD